MTTRRTRPDRAEQQLEAKLGGRFRWSAEVGATMGGMLASTYVPAPDADLANWKREVVDEVNKYARGWGGPEVTADDLEPVFAELKDSEPPS